MAASKASDESDVPTSNRRSSPTQALGQSQLPTSSNDTGADAGEQDVTAASTAERDCAGDEGQNDEAQVIAPADSGKLVVDDKSQEMSSIRDKDVQDLRSYICEPSGVHKTILAVSSYKTCNCSGDQEQIYLGTCFMLNCLYKPYHPGKPHPDLLKFHYFATAAHNLVCVTCKKGKFVRLATHWKPGDEKPDELLIKADNGETATPAVGLNTQHYGYTRVSGTYKAASDSVYERCLHDFGIIAIRAEKIDEDNRFLKAVQSVQPVPVLECDTFPLKDFYKQVSVCGYPSYVYDNHVTGALPEHIENDKSKKTSVQLPATGDIYTFHERYKVDGALYWVHPDDQSDPGFPTDTAASPKERYRDERNTSGLYPMPQNHSEKERRETVASTDTLLCKLNLFRHYIDTSPGQSGSPVYTVERDGLRTVYKAVGIHFGCWPFNVLYDLDEYPIHCNIAVRLSKPVLDTMQKWIQDFDEEDEAWTEDWRQGGGGSGPVTSQDQIGPNLRPATKEQPLKKKKKK